MSGGLWITTEDGTVITTEGGAILVTETPPPSPTPPLQDILPSYPYQEYADDENIVAFFDAYNEIAQGYLDWFNQTPLSVYTNSSISGQLLDWTLNGIYGIARPVFSTLMKTFQAGTDSMAVNLTSTIGGLFTESGTAMPASDDYYKRVATWILYAGNGRYFTVEMLRLRVARFIFGVNGTDITMNQAQAIHIASGLLANPPALVLSQVAGGSMGAERYAAWATYVSPIGETLIGAPAALNVSANNLLVANSPPYENGADGWNIYISASVTFSSIYLAGVDAGPVNGWAVNGSNTPPVSPPTRQNAEPIPIGTAWVEPPSGLIVGEPLPTSNTSNTPENFIITIPASAGAASQFFSQALEGGILPFPFQLTASVVIE